MLPRNNNRFKTIPAPPPPQTPKPDDNVCVCVFSSHPFWTSSSLDVPAGVTQEEGHTGFLIHLPSAVRALIFVARRIQPFLSLVDREVEFCVLRPSFMGIVFGSGILLDLVLFANRIIAEPKS